MTSPTMAPMFDGFGAGFGAGVDAAINACAVTVRRISMWVRWRPVSSLSIIREIGFRATMEGEPPYLIMRSD